MSSDYTFSTENCAEAIKLCAEGQAAHESRLVFLAESLR